MNKEPINNLEEAEKKFEDGSIFDADKEKLLEVIKKLNKTIKYIFEVNNKIVL